MSSRIGRRLARLEADIERLADPTARPRRPRDVERAVMRDAVAVLERAVALLMEVQQEQTLLPSTTEP